MLHVALRHPTRRPGEVIGMMERYGEGQGDGELIYLFRRYDRGNCEGKNIKHFYGDGIFCGEGDDGKGEGANNENGNGIGCIDSQQGLQTVGVVR